MKKAHILLVEDMPDVLGYNSAALKRAGYSVAGAESLEAAKREIGVREPDLIVLDIMLPDGSGLDLCRQIRATTAAPILFLTGLGESEQVIQGLRAGGDDYLIKPCRVEELLARIEAHLRRNERLSGLNSESGFEGLSLDPKAQRAFLYGTDLCLKPKEYLILATLIRNRNRFLTAEELYAEVWGMSTNEDIRTVLVHISNLRSKMKLSGREPNFQIIRSGRQGYRMICADEEEAF